MFTLASNDQTGTDGAQVNQTAITLGRMPEKIVAIFTVSTTGSPTTWDSRAAIEASIDGGTTWHQVVRFKDLTNAVTALQIVRGSGQTAIASADVAAAALNGAAAAAVVVDTPWPLMLRAVTKLQTLTGGSSPHVISKVFLEVA